MKTRQTRAASLYSLPSPGYLLGRQQGGQRKRHQWLPVNFISGFMAFHVHSFLFYSRP
jgi:hypothetical protein